MKICCPHVPVKSGHRIFSFLQAFWHLSSTASKWQAVELHMLPSRGRAWSRRSSLDSPLGWWPVVCGRCITGMSRGRLDPSTTCLRRGRSASLSRSSSDELNLEFYISSLPSFCFCPVISETLWRAWQSDCCGDCNENKHHYLRTSESFWTWFILVFTSQVCLFHICLQRKQILGLDGYPLASIYDLHFLTFLSSFWEWAHLFWLNAMVDA